MAYRGHKIIAFTPSGRKRTQSILIDNLRRFTDIVDQYQIWLNTDDEQVEDLAWLKQQPDNYPWVKVIERPKNVEQLHPKQLNTGYFYVNTTDEDTIYIRFDDDIVYIDDNFFPNLLDFRIDNPKYFLVMANIWNNAVISYIHQHLGSIPGEPEIEEPWCMNPVAWENPKFAETIHTILQQHIASDSVDEFFFDYADLTDAVRFSISCFCFFGKDFAKFNGVVGQREPGVIRFDEEIWLTEVYPTQEDRLNTICGSALVAHYSFMRQRPHLDTTDILETYRAIAKQKLSDSYYDLLEQPENVKERPERPKLEPFVLPRLSHTSSISDSLRAEMGGYKVNIVSDTKVEILYNGDVKKTIVANSKILPRSVDDALALAWRNDPRAVVNHESTDN